MAGLLLVWLAMLLGGAGEVDRSILLALYAADEPWLALAATGFTILGNWTSVVAVTLAGASWLAYRKRPFAAALLLAASFSGRLMVIVQKAWFARLRPDEDLRLVEVHYLSFPSGHSANSMIAFLTLALLSFGDPRHRRMSVAAAVALSVLIGVSRPMLGVHWPSDIVGGWALGLLWVLLMFTLSSRWNQGGRIWAARS